MLKLLIVDDNEAMREVLKKAFSQDSRLDVVGMVGTGKEAVSFASRTPIDIACLDVDMPGINGVEAAKQILDINPKCAIVFITAHDDYMSDAFELYAFDYIMKPFRLERLHKTMSRLIEEKSTFMSDHSFESNIDKYTVMNIGDKDKSADDVIVVKEKGGMTMIHKDDVVMVERIRRQTVIVTSEGNYVANKTMLEMESILSDKSFLRSHKSYIIRTDKIASIKVYGRWTYIVKFNGIEEDALLTKEKAKMLMEDFEILD